MSCLFQSLSYFIKNLDENQLRKEICDYLEKNPKIFEDFQLNELTIITDNMNLSQYISHMRNPSTWGSALELKCFCNIYNVVVIVHYRNRQIEFLPNSNTNNPIGKINIGYTGNHYFPI
jgi:hypothetical protein